MKKSKLLMLCLALVMGVTTFAFAGCAGPGNGGGDGGGVDSGGNGGGGTDTPTPPPTPPVTVDPELKNMSTYFSGIKTEYEKSNFTNESGQSVEFAKLVDRQIDVLAQDLIYRLTYVYGYNETKHNRTENAEMILKNVDNSNYSKGSNEAKVDSNKLLLDSVKHDSSHTNTNVSVKCVDCIQKSLNLFEGRNYLNINTYVNLSGAIEGRYTTLNYNALEDTKNSDNAWNWTAETSAYENYLGQYKNNLKMAIAQILANQTTFNDYNSSSYKEVLNNINSLGFTSENKTNIVNFIYDNVVGRELVDKDNSIINNSEYLKNNNYFIINQFIANAPYDNAETSPRCYKGYNIVIPAIVEQALSNTFENTNISLYPTMYKNAVESSTSVNGFNNAVNYSNIVLMPKHNAPATKLILKMTGYENSVGRTITINYDVVIDGVVKNGTKNVTLGSSEQEIELNLYSVVGNKNFKQYNGSSENDNQTDLFGNSTAVNEINNGDNYIKLSFTNTNNTSFIVTFGGMYDKM